MNQRRVGHNLNLDSLRQRQVNDLIDSDSFLNDDSPVLDVDISTILQGRDFNITNPFLRNAEHCIGKVADAPASPVSKCVSSISVGVAIVDDSFCFFSRATKLFKKLIKV